MSKDMYDEDTEPLTIQRIVDVLNRCGYKRMADKLNSLELTLPWCSPSGDEYIEQDVRDLPISGTPVCSEDSEDSGMDMLLDL